MTDTAQQFVTFFVNAEVFAFPMAAVREIIRVPKLIRVPKSPPALAGVANLRGQVLPVLSLRRSFNFEERAYDDATRVIILDHQGLHGFIVDRVSSVVTVEPAQIESVESIDATIDSDLLTALLKAVGGHAMVMCLDVDRLVRGGGTAPALAARGAAGAAGAAGTASADVAGRALVADERHLVSFIVDGQEYAFPIEKVQEIVQVPEAVTTVPNADGHVLGVMTLRNRLLPLVSLRRMFGLPSEGTDRSQRIVVLSLGREAGASEDRVVGVVMDAVKAVLRVPTRLIDALPAVLGDGRGGDDIEAICRLDDGKRIVSILSVARLFERHLAAAAALGGAAAGAPSAVTPAATAARGQAAQDDAQLVVFRLDGQEYGVEIAAVREIVRMPEQLRRVPKTAECISGVVNLRGQILPVIDFRARFGLAPTQRDERQRIVVLSFGDAPTGFVVDSVAEVLKVPSSAIDNVPSLSSEQEQLMGRMANLQAQKRMILLLSPQHLLDREQLGQVSAVRAAMS